MTSKEPELIKKVRQLKECLEKILPCISGGLFILSTSVDLMKLSCYWSDYVLMIYSCIFIVLMIWHSLMPNKIPFYIKENLGVVTYCNGKGYLMLIISFLFIKDRLYLHRLASMFLLLSGIILIILEILVPSIEEKNTNKPNNNNTNKEVKIEEKEKSQISIEEKIKNANNPYNIPDDF